MFWREIVIVVIICCLYLPRSEQRSTPQDAHYVAGVVEYNPTRVPEADLTAYEEFVNQAARQNVDILAFPEMTLSLTSPVAVPIKGLLLQYPIPANNPDLYHEVLVRLSRAALTHQMYIVVNFEEILNCTAPQEEDCPEEKVYLFNTNVVFDRNGAVIDRYRKINLFGEITRTPSLDKYVGVFDTDFGVRMGHFICFDLQFQIPSIQLVQKENITDIVFTTMWFSELPYLTAVQIQESYAYANDVNFIASGASNAAVGSAGSGIYSGKAGSLISYMPGVNTKDLLVANVSKIPGVVMGSNQGPLPNDPSTMDNLHLIRDPSLSHHISEQLKETDEVQEIYLEDDVVKCHFTVKMQKRSGNGDYVCDLFYVEYTYRATAFNGVRSYSGLGSGGSRLCSVIACTNANDISTCGTRFRSYINNSPAVFESLIIRAEVPTPVTDPEVSAQSSFYFPISLKADILPLEPSEFTYEIEQNDSGTSTYTLELVKTETDLISFSVWGRVFNWDGQPETIRENSAVRNLGVVSTVVIATGILLKVIF